MNFTPKLNLSRFKRSMQGIIDFAVLLEQADPAQRAKIIEQAENQDSEFLYKVMKKVVFFEELTYLDDGILAEILSKTSAKVLAFCLQGSEPGFRDKILKMVGHRELRQFRDEEERLGGKINPALILGAQKQVLKTGRTLEAQNKFVFELSSCPRFTIKKRKTQDGEPTESSISLNPAKLAK